EVHGNAAEVFVARLSDDGTSWVKVGGIVNENPAHEARYPTIASIGGVPWVAWSESPGGSGDASDIRVAHLDTAGTGWVEPWRGVSDTNGGINEDPAADASAPQLAAVGGVPYVAWEESLAAYPYTYIVRVARLDTSTQPAATWEEPWVGVSATRGGLATNDSVVPSIAAINGVPYVAFLESTPLGGSNPPSTLQLRVARLNVNTWEQPWTGVGTYYGGINQSQDHSASSVASYDPWNRPSLTSINNIAYVAWVESDGTNSDARVARLDTSTFPAPTWKQVAAAASPTDGGINESPNINAHYVSLTAVNAGQFGVQTPYLAWQESEDSTVTKSVVRVARFNATTRGWEQPWPSVSATVGAIDPALTTSQSGPVIAAVNGVPFVASADSGVRVTRLEPELTAATATPTTTSATLTVHAHTYGIPYPIGFQYGNALQDSSATTVAAAGSENVAITTQVSGVTPSTTFQFRPFAVAGTPFPLSLGTTGSFTTTAAKSTTTGGGGNTTTSSSATLSGLALSNVVFAVGRGSTPLSGLTASAHKRGTVFSFKLDRTATVTIEIRRLRPGRRSGRTCRAPTPKLRTHAPCTRALKVVTLTRTAHSGLNRVAFSGRIRGRALAPGKYEAVFAPSTASGSSPSGSLGFTIARH
ncbi:MAG TPA: hypothetical protein VFC30_03975, partial [Solirubrobacteraceae bacterium]|nr:hypothetical protein [Solirubrobacteraceae bacterium]